MHITDGDRNPVLPQKQKNHTKQNTAHLRCKMHLSGSVWCGFLLAFAPLPLY